MTGAAASEVESGAVRVLLYHRTADGEGIAAGYRAVSKRLAAIPGQLGNELLRDVHDPEAFVVLSKWASLSAFDAWERGDSHRENTAEIRPYRDLTGERSFAVLVVTDTY